MAEYCRKSIESKMNTVDSVVKNEVSGNSQTNNTINYETTETVETEHTSISEIENNNIKENENKEVSLMDATIEAEVRKRLGKPLGSLTISDLLMITDINVYTNTEPKVYLNDLVYMENLQTFVGARCSISDLNPLKELKNLTYMDIGNNPITDLTPLSNLTELQVLHINSDGPSDYTDISFLKSLSNLVELHLDVTMVNDLSPILSLTNLKTLKIDYSTKYKTIDVNTFMELPNLKQYVVNGKEVSIEKELTPIDDEKNQNLNETFNIDESKLIKEFWGIWLQKVYLNDGTEDISVFTINIKERSLIWVIDYYYEEYDFHEHQEYNYPIKIVSQNKLEFFQAGSSTATDSLELNSDGTLTRTFYGNNDKKILIRE
jgi:Leucine-rich repeat (LRR) protein